MAKDASRFRPYPDCFGFGKGEQGGVAGCQCKKIFDDKKREKLEEEERRRREYLALPPHVPEPLPYCDVYVADAFLGLEGKFDALIDEAPLDFQGTGSSAEAELDYKEFNGKVEKLKNLVRELLG